MQADPMEEWRSLTALYGQMGDIEIRELAGQIDDLTAMAQQVLRDELKKRGISYQSSAPSALPRSGNEAVVHVDQAEETGADGGADPSDGVARDYTWKTGLYRCDSIDDSSARCEMLHRAGIDSWIQRPGSRFALPWLETGRGDIQINVAADQLDQARAIAAQPIPQSIIDQMKELHEAPPYQIPGCPKCGTADPTLESIEPSNNWLCESCGHSWSDPVADDWANQQPLSDT